MEIHSISIPVGNHWIELFILQLQINEYRGKLAVIGGGSSLCIGMSEQKRSQLSIYGKIC